jgi:hypothetical protein
MTDCGSGVLFEHVGITGSFPVITVSVGLQENFTWKLYALGRSLDPSTLPTTSTWPTTLVSVAEVKKVLDLLDSLKVCPGIPDEKFYPLVLARKGKFINLSGTICSTSVVYWCSMHVFVHVCVLDRDCCALSSIPAENTVLAYQDFGLSGSTIRTSDCTLLFSQSRQCNKCTKFRVTLNAILRRLEREQAQSDRTSRSTHTNFRFLNTPEKNARLSEMRVSLKNCQKQIQRMRTLTLGTF